MAGRVGSAARLFAPMYPNQPSRPWGCWPIAVVMDGTENCSVVERAYIRPYSVAWARSGAVIERLFHRGRTLEEKQNGPPRSVSGTDHLPGGRYWVRTSDLFGVNEARYHCANRPGCAERDHTISSLEPVRTASPVLR